VKVTLFSVRGKERAHLRNCQDGEGSDKDDSVTGPDLHWMLGGESRVAPEMSVKIRCQCRGISSQKHAQSDQAASAEILAMVKRSG